jgi:subtilisin family serine protease
MTTEFQTGHVLARTSEWQPGDASRLNKVLDRVGLGRPLSDPADGPAASRLAVLIKVPVEPRTNPMAIQRAVQDARATDPSLPALYADRFAEAGTIASGGLWADGGTHSAFLADGKKSGHAFGGWVPSPDGELEDPAPWDPAAPHPMIALLDSGVQPHVWLTGDADPFVPLNLPFLQDADGLDGWRSPIGPVSLSAGPILGRPEGTHWGHGTFIAGLIRQVAPQARILSMRVMDSAGQVDDSAAINALNWLSGTHAVQPGIVLMAFGRRAEPGDPIIRELRAAVRKLTDKGVEVVASAGNDGSDQPNYPAAFAAEPGLPVISVGAIRSTTQMEPYSNHGPWVNRGWIGSDIVSIHPLTITGAGKLQVSDSIGDRATPMFADSYAWWSGTSFAAALVAAKLARGVRAGLPLPLNPAHP